MPSTRPTRFPATSSTRSRPTPTTSRRPSRTPVVNTGFPRALIAALVAAFVALAGWLFVRNLKPANRADNVATAPAGGRTQATSDSAMAVTPPGDPLSPGIPESPDIPADGPHAGLKKAGV